MGGIFISYRREDSAGWTGRLAEHLRERLGEQSIFMDLDGITPGVDFTVALHNALTSCDVLLAVIGPEWLTVRDESGKMRLDDPDDWVRMEIATALKRNIRVIPVLVGGAEVPTKDQLPDDLDPLAHRQAYELTDRRWNFDLEELMKTFPRKPWGIPHFQLASTTPVTIGGLVIAALVASWAMFSFLYASLPVGDSQGTSLTSSTILAHNPLTPPVSPNVAKTERIAMTPVANSDPVVSPLVFRVGQEARLKDHVTFCAYKVLAAEIERSRSDLHVLRITAQVTNEGSMTTNLGNSNFRLLVDNVPRAPTGDLNDVVEAHSAKEVTIVFTVPANATRLILQLLMGEEEATFPL